MRISDFFSQKSKSYESILNTTKSILVQFMVNIIDLHNLFLLFEIKATNQHHGVEREDTWFQYCYKQIVC